MNNVVPVRVSTVVENDTTIVKYQAPKVGNSRYGKDNRQFTIAELEDICVNARMNGAEDNQKVGIDGNYDNTADISITIPLPGHEVARMYRYRYDPPSDKSVEGYVWGAIAAFPAGAIITLAIMWSPAALAFMFAIVLLVAFYFGEIRN